VDFDLKFWRANSVGRYGMPGVDLALEAGPRKGKSCFCPWEVAALSGRSGVERLGEASAIKKTAQRDWQRRWKVGVGKNADGCALGIQGRRRNRWMGYRTGTLLTHSTHPPLTGPGSSTMSFRIGGWRQNEPGGAFSSGVDLHIRISRNNSYANPNVQPVCMCVNPANAGRSAGL
jgi:hypothetical protein